MKGTLVFTVSVLWLSATGLDRAQATYPYIGELKQNFGFVKNNLVRMAEKMPEEYFAFKPAKEIRTFGESVAHVADSQARSCSLVKGGEPRAVDAASKTTKADLVAALKESFVICDAAFDGLTDAGAAQMVRLGQSTRERSKLGLLMGVVSHSNEVYGYMSVYLRLKGIVPPSSEGQGG